MQISPTLAPAPPAPPTVPAVPAVLGSVPVGVPGGIAASAPTGAAPRTREQLAALDHHRSEISDQLSSVQHRRDDLAKQLRNPLVGGADRAGIEQRLTVVDARIVSLERDLDATGQLIAATPTPLLSSTHVTFDVPRHSYRSGFVGGAGLTLLAVLVYTRLVRRPRARPDVPAAPADSARLARVEQAIEAVAIEVERISEGQRFVTQLLAARGDEARIAAPAYATPRDAPR